VDSGPTPLETGGRKRFLALAMITPEPPHGPARVLTRVPSEPFEARVVAARRLSPAVREIVLERADGRAFRFEPGQWVNLVLPLPDGEIKRAYSIASPPEEGSPRFDIAVTHVAGGPGSQYLHALPEGARLLAIGPQGLFTRSAAEDTPSVFVGTGTGVTPLRSMIRSALAAGGRAPLLLLFGARREEDILYREELVALAQQHPRFRYEITLSQPEPSWEGRRGYVQAHLAELVAGAGAGGPQVYVCGLDRMVSAVRGMLRGELGVDRKHVHTERYD
jgi:CDP-4-dehydro-6-deoxyglucose reductase, E3